MGSFDPGSFRDPASRVYLDDGRVLRILDERGREAWDAVKDRDFFKAAVDAGRVIQSNEVEPIDGYAGVLEHPRLPFISYPYEWTFSMLKDAALLQLDLLGEALGEGMTIKDATPFNIQFVDGRPMFIDVGSFEPYASGEPWIGYQQFTRQFLYPLMLRAWVGISFQPFLRGQPDGPTPAEMKSVLSGSKRWSPGSLMHVSLQARMQDKLSDRAVRSDLREAGFSSDLIVANVTKLRRLVGSLEWQPDTEGWVDYTSCSHVGRDREAKTEFLTAALARLNPGSMVDLGANDCHFSDVARGHGVHSVAIDGDEGVLEQVYRRGDNERLSLAVSDLANPSPSQGWAGQERPGLFSRVSPDLVLAYGVIHHLIYTASVPPSAVLDWLRGFDCPAIVEFVSPRDDMAVRLAGNKLETELHPGRDESSFRSILADRFEVVRTLELGEGTRVLFELSPA